MKPLHFSITSKVAVGLGIILLLGMLSMLFIYRGLSTVDKAVDKLAEVEEPTSLAAYEMEINVNGMGLAVLKYLDDADPLYRAWAADDKADFSRFHDEYTSLTNTPQERRLGAEVTTLFARFDRLSRQLMEKKDTQTAWFLRTTENLEAVDRIIDTRIQPAIDRGAPKALAIVEASMDMEASIAELGLWATVYQNTSLTQYRRLIFAKQREFRRALARLQGLEPSARIRVFSQTVDKIADRTIALVRHIITLEDNLDESTERFVDLRFKLDNLLDDQIQILALADLTVPRKEADAATNAALRSTNYLIPAYILATIIVAALLIQLIHQPLRRLMRGTNAIGGGHLDYRIEERGGDEFADLARDFNRMVDQLQATTVSKRLLETSEANLHSTVAELRHEIGERERAEQERARLQIKLRRIETLSAMGALVAGVAHEVRNPLFGISATLDAMHARFKDREDVRRYTDVLRVEVTRLSRLMNELLDYGRPPALDLTRGSIEHSITLALQACAPLALRSGIEIVNCIDTDLPELRLDKARLSQVFQNLLQNAVQHSPPGSAVSIEVTAEAGTEGAWIRCVVYDSGAGLAEDDIARLFEPFFTRRRGGTGLGLAIVRRIVEEHGGVISAANRPEGGAVMAVRLPVEADVVSDGDSWRSAKS
ncbi:MAG: HAMP domain-containing protein [Gammaproteobacteria bacterium]|nr:HAMP domain-containing protein [Gammaproteobacteria bacterium]